MSEDLSRKRLGRGLSTLIGDINPAPVSVMEPLRQDFVESTSSEKRDSAALKVGLKSFCAPESAADDSKLSATFLPIENISANPRNPRQFFTEDELNELASSIAEHGVIQPILVREVRFGDHYEIIAGERRWRAAQRIGLTSIPVIVKNVDDRTALEIAIIENVQRANLNSLEEAQGYQLLINEHNYTQAELAQVIGKSRSYVTNSLRLLKLPAQVLEYVNNSLLSAGHARALVSATDPVALAELVIRQQLSVRQLESLIQKQDEISIQKQIETGLPIDTDKAKLAEAALEQLEALKIKLKEKIGLNVSVKMSSNGSGFLKLSYKNLEELQRIKQILSEG